MILDLPQKKAKPDPKEWHMVWCLMPRKIDGSLVWLSRVERRLVKTLDRRDGATDMVRTVKIWEYRLISWIGY